MATYASAKTLQTTRYMGWLFSLKTSQEHMNGVTMVTNIGACGVGHLVKGAEGHLSGVVYATHGDPWSSPSVLWLLHWSGCFLAGFLQFSRRHWHTAALTSFFRYLAVLMSMYLHLEYYKPVHQLYGHACALAVFGRQKIQVV